ncbi:CoA transferase [Pseudonocardia halophobica]|uniref:CoA transferase n=1 Tax=Pseudonocardia halophobica TaxID=29401 RepID=A0A9W6L7S4_9PSEU|nr:CoA transferase [Pseudonocardia halophobica]GLL14843.1 CoA transferase [Pseudonocardia halophobica]
MIEQVWAALGGDPAELPRLATTGPVPTLSSRFPVTEFGTATIGAALLAATADTGRPVGIDTRQAAVALRSERYLRRDGASPGNPFDPLSAFHPTADGWLRLHANYAWHAAAARRVLDLAPAAGLEEVRAAIAGWRKVELETALLEAGGVAAATRTEEEWAATEAGRAARALPLVERRVLGEAPPRPARRVRVLDLTRVIAGPVATRVLAAHGADVLRLDPPHRPEMPAQAWDTLPGKRSAIAELPAEDLLAGADVVVTGYRPGSLDRFGLAPEELAARHPGLVVVTLSAWGHTGPWAGRRGFDSLVQSACGIGVTEGSPTAPGALPAQVLDHATGYLGAAGALLALAAQRRSGGTHHVRLALAGTAAFLQALPRTEPGAAEVDPAPYLEELGPFTLASPPGTVDGEPLHWPSPADYGGARPAWLP